MNRQLITSMARSGRRSSASLSTHCSFCGTQLLSSSPSAAARRSFSRTPSRSGGTSISSSSSAASFRVPRWAITSSTRHHSSLISSTSSGGSSLKASILSHPSSSTSPHHHKRSFATVLSTPTIPEEDLPEPLLSVEEEKQSASNTINVTAAAERQLARIQERDNDPNLALRILVESGGCHGYSTKLQVADVSKDRAEDDYVLSAKSSASDSNKTGLILVDALTLSLIKGSTLDYATELIGSSFRLVDNPQATGKGCGCGVSWEMKI